MKRRRNPGLIDDLVLAGVLVGGLWYGAKSGFFANLSASIEKSIGQSILQPISSAANSASQSIAATVGPPTTSQWCDIIPGWQAKGQPLTIFGLSIGGYDPTDWGAFRRWANQYVGSDPGPTPPACWTGGPAQSPIGSVTGY